MQKAHRARPAAFTLVELLVVIGIIAVLISILLPSLTRAREAANSVQCLSNLRQLFQGTLFYAHDNRGFFPAAPINQYQWPVPRKLGRESEGGVWITSSKVWTCPTDYTDQINVIPGGYQNQYIAQANISYAYNQTCGMMDNQTSRIVGGPYNNYYPCFQSYRPEKSKTVTQDAIYFDVEAGTAPLGQNWTHQFMWGRLELCAGYTTAQTGSQLYSGRHMGDRMVNVVAGDGHAESIDFASLIPQLHATPPSINSQMRTLLQPWQCYVGGSLPYRVR